MTDFWVSLTSPPWAMGLSIKLSTVLVLAIPYIQCTELKLTVKKNTKKNLDLSNLFYCTCLCKNAATCGRSFSWRGRPQMSHGLSPSKLATNLSCASEGTLEGCYTLPNQTWLENPRTEGFNGKIVDSIQQSNQDLRVRITSSFIVVAAYDQQTTVGSIHQVLCSGKPALMTKTQGLIHSNHSCQSVGRVNFPKCLWGSKFGNLLNEHRQFHHKIISLSHASWHWKSLKSCWPSIIHSNSE